MNTKDFDIVLSMPLELDASAIEAVEAAFGQLFNRASVRLAAGRSAEFEATAIPAEGSKCLRCRSNRVEVGRIWKWPDLCWRCAGVMDHLEHEATEANTASGEWQTDPAAFKSYWLDHFDAHPIRALSSDSTVRKWVRRADGTRATVTETTPGDFILEVWGNEEQMPWIKPPSDDATTVAFRPPGGQDKSFIDYLRAVRNEVVRQLVAA